MNTEHGSDDESDNTNNCSLVSLLMNIGCATSTSHDTTVDVDQSTENPPEYATLSNVFCDDYIVPCDDDINLHLSEDDDDDEGNEIVREIGLITPGARGELNHSVDPGLNDLIVNCIQDENIKKQLLSLNLQLERNIKKCNTVAAEATSALLEKKALIKECKLIDEKIRQKRTVDDAQLRKIKKKKGKYCAPTGHNRQTYFCRFGIPYFKDTERYPAELNRDIKEINSQNQPTLYKLPKTRRFLKKDAQKYESLVLEQLKAKRINQLERYLKDVNKQIQSVREDECGDELLERKRKILDAIKLTSNVANLNDTKDWNLQVDFSTLMKDDYYTRFNGEDFERLWNLLANPRLSREDFSPEETSKLKELATKYKAQNWDKIAEQLGTNRTAFMCFTKYASMMKKGKNVPWTEEENQLLRKLGEKLQNAEKPGSIYHWWRNIRRHFPNRTYNQIHAHWSYVLAPHLKKGRFSRKECATIDKYVKQGKNYSEIAKLLGGTRSCVQIRSHCEQRTSKKKIKNGMWTKKEEDKLLDLVKEYGSKNWVKISELMKTRTRIQCRLKYTQMKSNSMMGNQITRDQSSNKGDIQRKGRWTEDETKLFAKLIKEHGHQWAKISKLMKTRSNMQCVKKYKVEFKSKEEKKKNKKPTKKTS